MTTVEERAESGGRGVSEEMLRGFFREMLLIRRFEEKVEDRFRAGELPGFLHVAIGQEAIATGVCAALEREDVIASTHRAHGHAIAKGTPIERIMAELYGKAEGCSGPRTAAASANAPSGANASRSSTHLGSRASSIRAH